ncbi:Na(+)/H(+) exchange regulatory cofactor NHE-RF2 [Merluccius polli]|uniref:Na(+)/H(+) exchange regulatory cofactor NHE-RF2 n=1 Tax=Merluccius polli TaxID=89951 RepID=A0AA47PE10_MERPO|nr:Na(+)/H(+) exchange regulatory cofactor NHE-RF2 [Merluccius polli]
MADDDEKPRLCRMAKGENGYGFHLHGEKGKSGQYIRKVEPASAAEAAGLRAGDRVVQVNGDNVEKETHHQVVQRIKALEGETRLLVVDRRTDEILRSLRLTATEEMAVCVAGPPLPIPTPTSSSPPVSPPTPASTPGGKKRENGSVPKQGQVTKPRRSASRAAKKAVIIGNTCWLTAQKLQGHHNSRIGEDRVSNPVLSLLVSVLSSTAKQKDLQSGGGPAEELTLEPRKDIWIKGKKILREVLVNERSPLQQSGCAVKRSSGKKRFYPV